METPKEAALTAGLFIGQPGRVQTEKSLSLWGTQCGSTPHCVEMGNVTTFAGHLFHGSQLVQLGLQDLREELLLPLLATVQGSADRRHIWNLWGSSLCLGGNFELSKDNQLKLLSGYYTIQKLNPIPQLPRTIC
jgi:hypothetical protein